MSLPDHPVAFVCATVAALAVGLPPTDESRAAIDRTQPACEQEVVKRFADEFRDRHADCEELPDADLLDQASCPAVEMAHLASGCLPADATIRTDPDRRRQPVEEFVADGDHPCRADDGALPDDGRSYLAFASSAADRLECIATDDSCTRARSCESDGLCLAVDDECEPTCDATLEGIDEPHFRFGSVGGTSCAPRLGDFDTCEDHPACRLHGMCTDRQGMCVADSSQECRDSEACRDRGRCVIDGTGRCEVKLDEHCQQSRLCETEGKCHYRDGECIDDEVAARSCHHPRQLIDGKCRFPPDFDCSRTRRCEEEDRCATHVLRNCDSTGACSGTFGVCGYSEEYCRSREECEHEGVCSAPEVSTTPGHRCRSPVMISRFPEELRDGKTFLVDRQCGHHRFGDCRLSKQGCANSVACQKEGRCSPDTPSRYCRPTRPQHCEQSELCHQRGACGLQPKSTFSVCGPTEDQHCEQAEICETEGACRLDGRVCKPE